MRKLTCRQLASISDLSSTKDVFLILHNIQFTLLKAYWTFLDCSLVSVLWLYSIASIFRTEYLFCTSSFTYDVILLLLSSTSSG